MPGGGSGGWVTGCRRISGMPLRSLVAHGIHDAIGHVGAIVHLGQLCEDAFERRLAHEFAKALDGVVGHHFAAAQDQDGGTDLFDHLEHVGTVQDDFAAAGKRAQQSAQHERGGDVQAGEGLVEDEDFGIVQQRGGEENLLAHALGVRREGRVAVVPESEGAEEFVHLGIEDAARHAAKPAHQLEILAAGEVRVEVGLLRHVADAPLEGGEVLIHAAAAVEDLAFGRLDQAGQHLHRGALAGSVGSEVAEDFAGPTVKLTCADGGRVVVILRQRPGFEHRYSVSIGHR